MDLGHVALVAIAAGFLGALLFAATLVGYGAAGPA
jgi:hypothetical protein